MHRHPDKPTELYIDEVGVSPAFQRQGIARKMLDAMFALGREHGCEELGWAPNLTICPPARFISARP
ncbi:GNAT family N-acetyltransferase [Mesorhizobium sp. CO1-1-4]|uniref:GNAT family N-acetyltransferase n=1 Tax=Mesorhizobium sp. CO1-1-4 TaxID=2876633 RepID=UPI002961F0C9|nr:GNAT family N-acetyltransferase [Mesorhizobium sp. CO1-1-4]